MQTNLKYLLSACLLIMAWSGLANANSPEEMPEGYYEFELATVEVIESDTSQMDLTSSSVNQASLISNSIANSPCEEPLTQELLDDVIDLNRILNVGSTVWAIIQDNKPIVDSQAASSSALPFGVSCWETLVGWSYPKTKNYRYVYKNMLGMTVADIDFKVIITPNGNYKGQGDYLANVSIFPENLTVAWGYKVSANAAIMNPVNMGSTLAPVAGMEAQLNWTVETPLKHKQATSAIFVTGLGEFRDL